MASRTPAPRRALSPSRERALIESVPVAPEDLRFTGIATPDEFFSRPGPLHALCTALARRFHKRAPFMPVEDYYQFAAVEVLNCRRKFKPNAAIPFGGYAWSSAIFYLTGKMHAASVPVSFRKEGSDVVNKLLRNLSAVSLDAPAGRDPEGAALGDTLRLEDTELGDPADPGTLDARATIVDAIAAASADIPAEVLDLVLAALDGQRIDAAELPTGWSYDRFLRRASQFRAVLTRLMGTVQTATREGRDVTRAMLRAEALAVPAQAPVTGADDVDTIAALGAAMNDPAAFDPWAGAFLTTPCGPALRGRASASRGAR